MRLAGQGMRPQDQQSERISRHFNPLLAVLSAGRLAMTGVPIGLPLAIGVTSVLKGSFFGVQIADPIAIGTVALALGASSWRQRTCLLDEPCAWTPLWPCVVTTSGVSRIAL
jgi:hypothetical protein